MGGGGFGMGFEVMGRRVDPRVRDVHERLSY